MATQVCVVGAGIMGVSTAYNILTSIPGSKVTIISDQFVPNNTSSKAAGIWYPQFLNDNSRELTE